MGPQHFPGVYENDSDPNPEEILVQNDHFIVALVEKMARRSSNIARPEVLDLEIDEIAQRVRIKFWHALMEKHIEHPQAYIRTIVRNEFNDIPRKRKPPLPLLADEDGELYMGDGVVGMMSESEGMANPADEFEADENLDGLMNCAASAVSRLPSRQQRSMCCLLNEQIDARIPLIEAFEKHDIDIEAQEWPEDVTDKKLMKASLSAARHRIAEFLGVNLDIYKKRGLLDTLVLQT
jgi:DNA-directed RNA polymerase specialized sigma24 family protein